jgi:hypothetical protein
VLWSRQSQVATDQQEEWIEAALDDARDMAGIRCSADRAGES